jgi:hypothetical protein
MRVYLLLEVFYLLLEVVYVLLEVVHLRLQSLDLLLRLLLFGFDLLFRLLPDILTFGLDLLLGLLACLVLDGSRPASCRERHEHQHGRYPQHCPELQLRIFLSFVFR